MRREMGRRRYFAQQSAAAFRHRELRRQQAEARPLRTKGRHTLSANTSALKGRRWQFRPSLSHIPSLVVAEGEVEYAYTPL